MTSARRASNPSLRLRTKRGQAPAPGMISLSAAIIWQPLHTPSANVSRRSKNAANMSRARPLNRIDFAHPSPAPSTSPYEKPPHAARPRKLDRSMRPPSRSVMCTSTASKPARSNAAAISICPLTPCSRRIATRGRAPPRARSGAATSSSTSNVVTTDSPGSSLSTRAACSSSAQVRSSRIDCMACVVSDQMPRRMLRRSSNTVRPSRRRMTRSPRCDVPERAHRVAQAVAAEHLAHARDVGRAHGEHRAQLLGEQARDRIVAEAADLDVQADAARERHLGQRHEQAAVAAIVVRGDQARRRQLLHRREQALEQRGIVEVGRRLAELAVDLRQRRAAQPVLAAPEIDEQQLTGVRVAVGPQLGRQRAAHVADGRDRASPPATAAR